MSLMNGSVKLSTRCMQKTLSGIKLVGNRPESSNSHPASSRVKAQYLPVRGRWLHTRRLSAMVARDPEQRTLLSELATSRALFDAGRFALNQPRTSSHGEFSFPIGTMYEAPNARVGVSMASTYRHALNKHGIVAVQLGFDDPDSRFILSVIEAMGYQPDSHSASHGALWDVKFQPEGVRSEATGKSAHSISHSMGEFAWHTDGAFETNPTRFFGFHILHPDRRGGGVFRVLRSEHLMQKLSDEAVKVLTQHEYDLRVPDEFFKGERTVRGKVLDVDPNDGKVSVRYRHDILVHPPSTDIKACKAIEELENLLGDPEDQSLGESIPEFAFKENMVLFMDNARFLHSRTKIRDPKRWLRRVRFHCTARGGQQPVSHG